MITTEMTALVRQGIRATTGASADRLPVPPARLAQMFVPLLSGLAIHAYFAPAEVVEAAYRDFRTLLERALEPDPSEAPQEEP